MHQIGDLVLWAWREEERYTLGYIKSSYNERLQTIYVVQWLEHLDTENDYTDGMIEQMKADLLTYMGEV